MPEISNRTVSGCATRLTLYSYFALSIIPVVSVLLVLVFERAKGPFWLGSNSDPDYAYLLNALSLAIAKMPALSEHPGTTLQAFGAIVLRLTHLFFGRQSIVYDVLSRPEFYLYAINFSVLAVFAVLQTAAGIFARRLGNVLSACIMLQAAPFMSLTSIESLACVKPEAFMQPIVSLLMITALIALANNTARFLPFALGAIIAAGVVTKVTFLPVLLVPHFLLSGWRARLNYMCFFALTTCVLLLPIYKLWPHMFASFWGIASHTGTLGAGAPGFLNTALYAENLWMLIRDEWLAALAAVVSLAVALVQLFRKRRDEASSETIALGAIGLAQIAQFVVVAKHPGRHYLQPALSLLGLNLFLICRAADRQSAHISTRALALCAMAAPIVFQLAGTVAHARDWEAMRMAQMKTVESQRRFPEGKVFYHYRSSSLVSALAFGDGYAGGRFGRDLHRLYPRALFYSLWHKRFYNFNEDFPPETVAKWAASEPVFLQGSPFEGGNAVYVPANFLLERVSEPGPEVLYRITPSVKK